MRRETNPDSVLSATVRNQFRKASYGLRANFFRPEREPERVHFLPTSHRLVIWTMGGLNHRSFDLVWSDECLGGRGKDCTSQSLNCKLLFVRITAHSRLHTKNLKSTELAGSRGTRQSFLGTRGPCMTAEFSKTSTALAASASTRKDGTGRLLWNWDKGPEERAKKFRSLDAQRSFAKRNQLRVLSARTEPIPEGFVWVKGKLLPPRTRTRMSTLSPNLP